MDIENLTREEWTANQTAYEQQIKNENVWNRVPLLNVNDLHNFKDGALVRFCGMIQDMHDLEYYLEKYEVTNDETQQSCIRQGKYYDIVTCNPNETIHADSPASVKNERHSYVAISIPALNDWAVSVLEEKYKLKQPTTSSVNSQKKRTLEHAEEMDTESVPAPQLAGKKQCTVAATCQHSNNLSPEYLLNFPIPDSKGKACHLKVYDNEALPLNAMGEFVGFLSVSPMLAENSMDDDEMNNEEYQTHHPPPSLIPRIHCVAVKKLNHNNPLMDNAEEMSADRMKFLKNELLILFTQLLLGDALAAEYLIYNILSEIHMRKDSIAIGQMCLNISNVPIFQNIDYVAEFYKFIELLVEKSHYIPLTLENINDLTFAPKKDYTSNRISSSLLQLTKNTHLVLDETKLCAGKINSEGINNIKVIADTIKNQKTVYDFQFYQLDFDTDITFLVFSEGKSMLPSDCHVVLKPDELHVATVVEIFEAAKHFVQSDKLNDIRIYFTAAKSVPYELTDSVQAMIQNDFVNLRQTEKVTADDLHRLLVLARLICISEGKVGLDEEGWKRALRLEEARRQRVQDIAK